MPLFLFILFFLFSFSFVSHSSLAESVPGTSCSTYPNGAVMHSGGPEISGKAYVMTCTAGVWAEVTINADPCAVTSPELGAVCKDGTLYAGLSPDGNAKMYVMPHDINVNGYTWNKGSGSWFDTDMVNCDSPSSSAASCTTGRANTAFLVSSSDAGSPYQAARYCDDLVLSGYSDWYLPAKNELAQLYAMKVAGKGSFANDEYWSSSEYHSYYAWYLDFTNGLWPLMDMTSNNKANSFRARCVRR